MEKHKETKPRTTAQLWARRESIKRKIGDLQAEADEITAQLEAELKK